MGFGKYIDSANKGTLTVDAVLLLLIVGRFLFFYKLHALGDPIICINVNVNMIADSNGLCVLLHVNVTCYDRHIDKITHIDFIYEKIVKRFYICIRGCIN